jgi:hypothetical protein
VRFEDLTAVSIKSSIFSDVTLVVWLKFTDVSEGSSGSKSKPSKQQANDCCLFDVSFDTEDVPLQYH